MTLEKFRGDPWKNSHPTYQESALRLSPAPEYASSEVLLSSLYRHIGLETVGEGAVPQLGRELDRKVLAHRDKQKTPSGASLDPDTFLVLLHSVMESPKLPNQSSKRFVQVTPLVPQAAIFSGSARLSSNSWPAGALVRRMVWLGSPDRETAARTWQALFDALSVTEEDDVFARFIQSEFKAWSPEMAWNAYPGSEDSVLSVPDRHKLVYPAGRFVRDLNAIITAKDAMTRRQWTSLLEAIIRIAAVAHVTWICDVQNRVWGCLAAALGGVGPMNEDEARADMFPSSFQFLSFGDRALPAIKDRASAFLRARLGINAVLWALESKGAAVDPLSSAASLAAACAIIRERKEDIEATGVRQILADIEEQETRTLLCKKGIGSNILEFARHVLGQRQAANPVLRGYDQGFALRKRSASNASPWVAAFGPVSVLALVHCALSGTTGPRSVRRLSQHLASYGVAVDYRDIATNDLGNQLRLLGLVLDSPDAESGMLLVPPFPLNRDQVA